MMALPWVSWNRVCVWGGGWLGVYVHMLSVYMNMYMSVCEFDAGVTQSIHRCGLRAEAS